MLLRSAVVFVNGCRSINKNVLCELSRSNVLISHVRIHCRKAHRSSFQRPLIGGKESIVYQLKLPMVFTLVGGPLCLLQSQYIGKLISPQTPGDTRTLSGLWNVQPDWIKVYSLICGSCVAVFLSFRLGMLLSERSPMLLTFMHRYFVCKAHPASSLESCAQLLLSTFAHQTPLHLGLNMFILYKVTESLVPEIGKDNFLGGYLFCGLTASLASMTYQLMRGAAIGSVGASGAILGCMGLIMLRHPEYSFYIIFLPFFNIPANIMFGSMLALDIIGCIRGWTMLDHAGHVGGLLSGVGLNYLYKSVKEEKQIRNTLVHEEKLASLPDESNSWWAALMMLLILLLHILNQR